MPPRILHVDLDAFFVEVSRMHHPELRDVEFLIVGGRRDQRGVVQSASYPARALGVRSGMPIAQAARLCPRATFFQGSFASYRRASRAVARVLESYSPTVVMASLDEAYLDFTGTERLYPVSLLPVAERLRLQVRQEAGLDCSIGIGANRMVAKLASDAAKPRGLMEIRPGWEEGFLAGLELSALPGIGHKTAARLSPLGLTLVWQVQQMRLEALEALIGEQARWLKHRAHGHGGSRLTPDRTPRTVSRETTLARDTTDPLELDRLLALFAAKVAAQLRDDALAARTVTLKLRHGDFHTVTRRATLGEPTDLDGEIYRAARALFEPAFQEVLRRGQGVRLLGVGTCNIVPAGPAGLFDPPERTREREITRVVDRVRERFGFEAVKSARLLGKDRGRDP